MKKRLIITIILLIVIIILKYWFSNYDLKYTLNSYKIKTKYNDGRFYYEIKDNNTNYIYNFDVYKNRSIKKSLIIDIKKITDEDNSFECIVPKIDDIDTYPLCYMNNEYIRYELIDSELLAEYKKEDISIQKNKNDFIFYNNLNNNEYVALWNYKGYIIMNGKSYSNIEIFEKDKYDNSQAYMIDNYIYIPNYDEEHEYTKLIKLNVVSKKYDVLELNYKIDHDSYIVGNVKKNLYIFDNKYSILYEINIKNGKTSILSNNEKGFVKYENGEFVSCSKTEYKNNKIKYNIESSIYNYEINNGLFKSINDNNKLKEKINNNDVIKIKENNNILYYLEDDNFYKYDPFNCKKLIFYNYELKYNNTNTVFAYIK